MSTIHDFKHKGGYDELERWAHEEDRKRIEALRKKREVEEAAAKAKSEEDDPEDKLHYRYYGADS